MFGYLSAATEYLTEEELERYRACYCGLCRSLKKCNGQISRFTLNFDMTFLILLLNSLYEADEISGEEPCIAHPFKKRKWWSGEISDYASDMNIALAYLNCLDDAEDEKKLSGYMGAAVFKRGYENVNKRYPRQCAAMEESITALKKLEKAHEEDPDKAAALFGNLMGNVFVLKEDRWSNALFHLGDNLGRFIYLLDACMDIDKDVKTGNFNPFRKFAGGNNAERFREYLKMYLTEALVVFDYLPLVKDVSLLKNILCLGLWREFEKKYSVPNSQNDR